MTFTQVLKMTIITLIMIFLLSSIVMYLVGAFIYMSLDPHVWKDTARCNLALIAGFFSFLLTRFIMKHQLGNIK